jgi:apolipoprotein D and lipocalin family protein
MLNYFSRIFTLTAFIFLLSACTSLPDGIQPVKNFELPRYLGTWYEIARLDHPFERGLEQISAQYSMLDDGGIEVLNRGFNIAQQEWEEADGKAYFVGDSDTAHLKVSFFGPFYASYVIFLLDMQGYEYAMITGPDRDYLWILARQTSLPEDTLNTLVQHAKDNGYATDSLIYVDHTP